MQKTWIHCWRRHTMARLHVFIIQVSTYTTITTYVNITQTFLPYLSACWLLQATDSRSEKRTTEEKSTLDLRTAAMFPALGPAVVEIRETHPKHQWHKVLFSLLSFVYLHHSQPQTHSFFFTPGNWHTHTHSYVQLSHSHFPTIPFTFTNQEYSEIMFVCCVSLLGRM